ncbi:hypothetical protein BZM27_34295 [Paraburkholderia steynii]|uniref:Uncharacterized protein n=1 Tax=Paraburkholderia steynii TaxID=1245441 RepID=A0A4R0X5Y8_9BURK|nr:hypothetical protein BZM27_34295 [Paraburkholderia steynii]
MDRLLTVRIKNLFIVTLFLKIVSSGAGWYLQSPWILGLVVPLCVMLAYIAIGAKRTDKSLSDEKFADSCYYLGFLFTITSIVFSLFDLPNIGTQMSVIAVRFGAAMISTLLGLSVRVFMVSFREDLDDAVKSAEDKVIESTHRLGDQLTIALDRFRDFQSQVDEATTHSIAKVAVGIEELTKSYGEQLTHFFAQLVEENTKAFKASQAEVRAASERLSSSVDGYAAGLKQSIGSIENRVIEFSDVVTRRLENTMFPDDYFTTRLAAPLGKLSESTTGIAAQVATAARNVSESLETVQGALSTIRSHAGEVNSAFESLSRLTRTQETLLSGSQAHVDTLETLNTTLSATQATIAQLGKGVVAQNEGLAFVRHELTEHAVGMGRLVAVCNSFETAVDSASQVLRSPKMDDVARALGEVTTVRQNSKNLLEVAHRIETATQELPHMKEVLFAMAEKNSGLTRDFPTWRWGWPTRRQKRQQEA